MTGPPDTLGADVRALVRRTGIPLAEVTVLTRLPSPVMAHASFRLVFADGRVLKARRVESAAQAERVQTLVAALDARHFPRIVDRHGAALLEEWVPGEPLATGAGAAMASRCGAVLGAVHHVVPPAGVAGSTEAAEARLDRLERQAGELERLGLLDRQAVERLRAIARAHAPSHVSTGVIHRDFCAENIVLREPLVPCVVDNETVRIDALDFDLARTWYRWPMTERDQAAFLVGYASHRSPRGYLESFPFWAVCVLVDTALFRQRARTTAPSAPLDRLSALLRDPTAGPAWRASRRPPARLEGAAPIARGYRYRGLTVRVESPETAHLAWLDEFLMPAFEPTDGGTWNRRVVLDTDPRRYAATRGRGPIPSGARAVCFVLDGRTVSHPEWQAPDDERVVFDEGYRAFYAVRPGSREVRILTDGHPARTRSALMRVVRELAMAASVEEGALLLHAAALASGQRGIALAGPKGAGKTTLLLGALGDGDTRFVSNDRAVVSLQGPTVRIRGLPTIVAVRPGTLAMFPHVAGRIRGEGYRHDLTLAEARLAPRPTGEPVARPASLTPAQLCDAVGARAQAEAELWRVVFPLVDRGAATAGIEPLDPAMAARRLAEALFGSGPPGRVSEVFAATGGAGVSAATLQRRCAELAARVPCYAYSLAPDAHAARSAAALWADGPDPRPPR